MIIENEEIFIIDYSEDESKKIIYAPLRSYLALANQNIVDTLVSSSESEIKEDFFQNLKDRPVIEMQNILHNLHTANPELSLAITDNCNLRCVYCHASAGEAHKQNTMSYEMIDAIMTKYFDYIKPSKYVKISFDGGGEPTYNFRALEYAINKAKQLATERNTKCQFSMASNGYYGENVRKFITNEFSHISLSFDGPEFIHNLHRPTSNGEGSFSTVFDTAKYFYNNGLSFAFRATISDQSLNYLEAIIDFFADNFPNKSIGLEHLNLLGRANSCLNVLPPNKKEFTKRLVDLIKYSKGKAISILNSASTEYDIIRPVFCSNVGIPNWTVNINGEILACVRDNVPDEFVFGKYDFQSNTLLLDDSKIEKLRKMVVLNYKECKDCFCKYHCAGDCPDRRMTDKLDCESIKQIGSLILNNKINNKEVQHAYSISSPNSKNN
jgi:radical SAM protein with 4Fe4S-binding SPASM domain